MVCIWSGVAFSKCHVETDLQNLIFAIRLHQGLSIAFGFAVAGYSLLEQYPSEGKSGRASVLFGCEVPGRRRAGYIHFLWRAYTISVTKISVLISWP
jgi:hypothetical protein